MNITHNTEAGQGGAFLLHDGEQLIGDMTYRWRDDHTIIIDHTGVDQRYQGQGLARQLVDAGIRFAREKQLRIVPACSYVATVFRKADGQLDDVWADH